MDKSVDAKFLDLINANLGIAHKVCRIYFDDPDSREDVIQEMMYQLWKSFPSFDGHAKFSTWMYSVCLNTALTYRRNENKERSEAIRLAHHNIPEEPDSRQDDLKLLFKGIATLTALNKAIVLLYLEDMSYDEMAAITGLTKSNVSVRLVRIKKELESYIKQQTA